MGLGAEIEAMIRQQFSDYEFSPADDVDGLPAVKGVSGDGFATVTLVGDPYLVKAELQFNTEIKTGLDSMGEMTYSLIFLEAASKGGEEAAMWMFEHRREALQGKVVSAEFGNAKVTLKSHGIRDKLLVILVEPAAGYEGEFKQNG